MINGFHKCFAFVRKLDVKENFSDYLQAFKKFPSTAVVAPLCKYLALCISLKKKQHSNMPCFLKIPSVQVLKVFFPGWICETRGLRLHFCLIGAYLNTPGIPYVHFAI